MLVFRLRGSGTSSSALNHAGCGQLRIMHAGTHADVYVQLMSDNLLRLSGLGSFA